MQSDRINKVEVYSETILKTQFFSDGTFINSSNFNFNISVQICKRLLFLSMYTWRGLDEHQLSKSVYSPDFFDELNRPNNYRKIDEILDEGSKFGFYIKHIKYVYRNAVHTSFDVNRSLSPTMQTTLLFKQFVPFTPSSNAIAIAKKRAKKRAKEIAKRRKEETKGYYDINVGGYVIDIR